MTGKIRSFLSFKTFRKRMMKKYTLVYEVQIEAKNLEEAEELADTEEERLKMEAHLMTIKGTNESLDRFYDLEIGDN